MTHKITQNVLTLLLGIIITIVYCAAQSTSNTSATTQLCTTQVLTPPAVTNINYIVGQSLGSYILPEFGSDFSKDLCPLTYKAESNDTRTWLDLNSISTSCRCIDWFTNDAANYGTYQLTFTATGIEGVTSKVSFLLFVKRPCIDALFFIKINSIPSYSKYVIEDPPLVIQIPESAVYSDQSFAECPQKIIFDVTYADGTPLIPELFNWDPLKQVLTTQTSNYPQFVNNTFHSLKLTAHYKDVPVGVKSESMPFTIDLEIDCNRIPYDPPFVANYTYMIGFSSPYYSVYIPPTYCGNWIYNFNGATYQKNLSWCKWCIYKNQGLFSFDQGNYMFNILNVVGSDKGDYQVRIPVYVPNTNIVQYINFMVTISYCQVTDFILTPIDKVIHNVFDSQLTIEVPEFVQIPLCGYTLNYQWRYLDPKTGTIATLPTIFTQSQRFLTVKTSNALKESGLYKFQVQGAVSLLYMSPQKATSQEVQIEVVNPCLETVINSDNKLGFQSSLSVPLGESKMTYRYNAPNDKVSLLYGNGRDSCGERDFKITDPLGNPVNLKNFQFLTIGQEFEFTVTSFPNVGTLYTSELVLKVFLVDYPSIFPAIFPITIVYREQLCQVTDFTVTTFAKVFHNVFDPSLTIEVPEFVQIPQCGYTINYEWRYLDPKTGTIATLPTIFTQSQRFLTVKTSNALKESGLYKFQVQGAVSLLYMSPQKATSQEVQIEVVNPCLETVINSDNKLGFQSSLSVPLGESKMTYRYNAPNDKVSLLYGNGRDSCGERDFKVTDSLGNPVNLKNFQFLTIGQEFEITVTSFPNVGTLYTSELVLKVFLVDYPSISPAIFQITIVYREQITSKTVIADPLIAPQNKTESGYEVPFIDPKFTLEPLIIDGYKNVSYTLPEVKNSLNVVSPIYINLTREVAEFLNYDKPSRTFSIYSYELKEKHQGIYNIVVQFGFGFGKFEQLKSIPIQIIVKNLKIATNLEETTPVNPLMPDVQPANNQTSSFFFEPGRYTPAGIKVPEQEVFKLTQFEVKETLRINQRTGKEPVPSLKGVDQSGLLTINWDKMMKKPANLDLIQSKEYAVMDEAAGATKSDSRNRRILARRREWFNTNEQYLKYLLIIEALEINIIATFDDGQDAKVPFTWDLVVFDSFDIQIQLYFRQEDMFSQRSQKNIVSVIFWGTEFFKDIDDNEVRFGENIETVIRWQVTILPKEMEHVLKLAGLLKGVIITIICLILPLFLALQESLLSLWIMLVSLQLIVHMALMQSMMPAEVVLFLLTILQLFRLPPIVSEKATRTPFNPIFEMAGYTETLMFNNVTTTMTVLLSVLICLASVLIVIDQLVFRKRRLQLPLTMKTLLSSFITFVAYFFAFCLFEVTLCAMIEMKVSESSALAWFSMILLYIPFVYAGTFLFKFQARFNSPPRDEFFESVQQSKIDETLHTPQKLAKTSTPPIPQLEESQKESSLVESSIVESYISQSPMIEEHNLSSMPNQAPTPLEVYIASEKDLDQVLKSLSNISSCDKNGDKYFQIGNEPMPEPTVSQQYSDNEKQIDEDYSHKQECLEGGSIDLAMQAKVKVYYESELKTQSQAITTLIFGRKLSRHALIFNLAFPIKAFICCFALVFGAEWPFPAQVLVIFVSTTIQLCITLDAGKSFWVSGLIHYQYIMNEVVVCSAAMLQFCFSEFVDDFNLRQQIGTAFIILIFSLVLLNIGFMTVQIYMSIKDKIRIRRLRLEQERLRKERIIIKNQEISPEKRKLSDWLAVSLDPVKNCKAEEEDQLQQSLHRKNKSSKVGPFPDSISEHYSEYSLHSFRPCDQEKEEAPQDQNIPLNRNLIQEQQREEGLPDIYNRFNINIDQLVENFDSRTPSDQDQDDLNLTNKKSYLYGEPEDFGQKQEQENALDFDQNLETVLGLCTLDRLTRDEARNLIPSVMRDAMEIAEELKVFAEVDCLNVDQQSENSCQDNQSRLSFTALQQANLQEKSKLSFFKKLDEVDRSLNEEYKPDSVLRRETHLKFNSLQMHDSLELQQDDGVIKKSNSFFSQTSECDSLNDKSTKPGLCSQINPSLQDRGVQLDDKGKERGDTLNQRTFIQLAELGKKENEENQKEDIRVAPKKLAKAAKWAIKGYNPQKTVTVLPEKPDFVSHQKRNLPQLQSTKIQQPAFKANKQFTIADESAEKDYSFKSSQQNQVFNSARINSSSNQQITQIKLGQRLRNRSQGELIMESSVNINKKQGAIRKSIGSHDSDQGVMSLKLMKANDPKISQLEISVFGDSSPGFQQQDGGNVKAFEGHVIDFAKTAQNAIGFYSQKLQSHTDL